jgi:SRSO17 transposase
MPESRIFSIPYVRAPFDRSRQGRTADPVALDGDEHRGFEHWLARRRDRPPAEIAKSLAHLSAFAQRYKPLLTRKEQEGHLQMYLEGLVSGLERKSIEPIATPHDVPRRGLQRFVGEGSWEDDLLRKEMRRHIGEELGDANAVLVLDGSGFPKKGEDSVGVARQWCGRLGKVDNCQVGVFLAYSAPGGHALVDTQIYMPKEWTQDDARRLKCHVPKARYQRSKVSGVASTE